MKKLLMLLTIIFTLNITASTANAETEKYLVTPTYIELNVVDIKGMLTAEYWICLECIKDMIRLDNTNAPDLGLQHRIYQRTGQALPIEFGWYPIEFVMEYQGFWIWKIKE